MKIQKLFENWNKFKADVIKEEILNEISYEYAEHVEDWMGIHGNEVDMPFNDIFNGKMRTVVPLGKSITKGTTIARILNWLEQQGYEVDFKTGLASKGFMSYTGDPSKPGTEQVSRVKHQKIGKVLQRAQRLNKKARETGEKKRDFSGEWYRERGSVPMEPDVQKEYDQMQDAENRAHEEYHKHFRHLHYGTGLEDWVDFWNKDSRYYRENPDKMMTDYSIIISRHPVDVLRMSDFSNIHSCHSEGSEMFHCAVKEAKGNGPIAYVVETQDLQDIDIHDNEIFEDNDRGVDGIEALSRVRLRRFDKTGQSFSDNQYSLAIPEKRIYGVDIPGFYEKVREWALEVQRSKWQEALEGGDTVSADYLRDFVMKGGHYKDTMPRDMFGKFFEEHGSSDRFQWASGGAWSDDESEEEEFVRGDDSAESLQEMANDYDWRCSGTERNLNLNHSHVNYEIVNQDWEEWDDATDPYEGEENTPNVRMYGSMRFEIELDGPAADDFPTDWQDQHSLARSIMKEMTGSDPREGESREEHRERRAQALNTEVGDYNIEDDYLPDLVLQIDFDSGYNDSDPTGFEQFCDSIQEDDAAHEKHLAVFRRKLVELGFVMPSRVDKLHSQIESKEIEFDNFTLTYDNEGGYNLIYPMEEEVFLIGPTTGDIRGVLGVTYGDTRDLRGLGSGGTNSFTSNKFKTDVLNQLTKYFVRAAQETNKQLQMDLEPDRGTPATRAVQEGEESPTAQRAADYRASRASGLGWPHEERFHAKYPAVKPEEIQEYITDGFVLGLERLRYTSAGTGGSQEREMKVGESRKARVTVLRFVLEDDAPEGFPDDQADELMLAAVKFVQYLDKDIEQLRHAINGILQTADQKVSGQITAADEELANMFEQLKAMHAAVLAEIDKQAYRAGTDRPGRAHEELDKWRDVKNLIDDLLIDIAASKKPQTILRYISDFRFTYQTRFKAIKDKVNQIETVEELSQLFEETRFERIVREEIEAILYG